MTRTRTCCVPRPTVQDFYAIEGELSREIVDVEGGGDPVLVVMAEYSLYVMTNSTIIEYELEQGLVDIPVPIRFFNFEGNVGAQATTSEAWDGQPTDWISVFPLPLEQEGEGSSRRIRRLGVPPPNSCKALSIETKWCEVQGNGATQLANGCDNFVPLCLPLKIPFLKASPPLKLFSKVCDIVKGDCLRVERALCSEQRTSLRQEELECCGQQVRQSNYYED